MIKLSLYELKATHLHLQRSMVELLALRIEFAKAQRKLKHSRARQAAKLLVVPHPGRAVAGPVPHPKQ